MLYVYLKESGQVVGKYTDDQNLKTLYYHNPKMLNVLDSIHVQTDTENYKDYKIIDSQLVKMTNEEIFEIQQYGRFLTEEERQLQKLKPSPDEVQKAENTIEILSLLQEVGI